MHLTPMRVASVRTSLLNIPLVRPHVTSVARIQYQSLVLVRVRTTDGVEGFGEAVVPGGPWWSGDSIEGIEALIHRCLAPLLIGEDAANIDFQIQRLNRLVPGAHFAKAGVDMALWDARGKSVVQIRDTVSKPRSQVNQSKCRFLSHSAVAVGSPRRDPFEQA